MERVRKMMGRQANILPECYSFPQFHVYMYNMYGKQLNLDADGREWLAENIV